MAATQRAPAQFKEGHLEVDGFQIRYWEAGDGDSIIMLGAMPWGLTHLHHTLATAGRVIAFEIPGLGQSPVNDRSTSLKELADTMARATAMIEPSGHTLVGESFGANVALWQAIQSPNNVEALILISPSAILPSGRFMAATPGEMPSLLFAHPENGQTIPQLDPVVFTKEQQLTQRLKAETHDSDAANKLGEIQCPTLVVFGLEDKIVAKESASVYREKIPNCNVSIVYDAGHAIVADRPEALASVVSDFVERRETFIVGRQSGLVNP